MLASRFGTAPTCKVTRCRQTPLSWMETIEPYASLRVLVARTGEIIRERYLSGIIGRRDSSHDRASRKSELKAA